MTPLRTFVPDAQVVAQLPASDLAGYVLEVLLSAGAAEQGIWNRRNFCGQTAHEYASKGQPADWRVGVACSTAWSWLEANGFICKHPEQDNEWFVVTPRGEQLRTHQEIQQFVKSETLPEALLHPEFLTHVRPLFLQNRLDTAVFEAFKSLEIAIRTTAKLGHEFVGVSLASRAFNPDDGPLTIKGAEKGERVALMNLMAGALGSYKNPTSHRRVELSADEARDMIVLASHLLKIVYSRA